MTYRSICKEGFSLGYKYTDIFISAPSTFKDTAYNALIKVYEEIEEYGRKHPIFLESLLPLPFDEDAPSIIKHMFLASSAFDVGPMAAVAGAIALYVGESLCATCSDVIVENGGDVFISTEKETTISLFAPTTPFKRLDIKIGAGRWGICTSSGRVGHSLSFGDSDAVTVLSHCPVFADAAATALANKIKDEKDLEKVLSEYKGNPYIKGILLAKGERVILWGTLEIL